MAIRCQFEGSNEIGVFTKLTNSYCLVGIGGTQNFYSTFEEQLGEVIPVVHASIAGCRIVALLLQGTDTVYWFPIPQQTQNCKV
ncbi:Eukaryotic translation initiation factor 6 [Armadillidium vulgare]|nr:Eukaryotic translation initiation factor 6 [Armadillidium vulgare]